MIENFSRILLRFVIPPIVAGLIGSVMISIGGELELLLSQHKYIPFSSPNPVRSFIDGNLFVGLILSFFSFVAHALLMPLIIWKQRAGMTGMLRAAIIGGICGTTVVLLILFYITFLTPSHAKYFFEKVIAMGTIPGVMCGIVSWCLRAKNKDKDFEVV